MTMGPEPRIRIFEMSVRLGIYAVLFLSFRRRGFDTLICDLALKGRAFRRAEAAFVLKGRAFKRAVVPQSRL